MAIEDRAASWWSLPRRVHLDSSTLQTIYDSGAVIWEGELFVPAGRAARAERLEALPLDEQRNAVPVAAACTRRTFRWLREVVTP